MKKIVMPEALSGRSESIQVAFKASSERHAKYLFRREDVCVDGEMTVTYAQFLQYIEQSSGVLDLVEEINDGEQEALISDGTPINEALHVEIHEIAHAVLSDRNFANEPSQISEDLMQLQRFSARADTMLLFVCPTPDDAEAAVGDLMERFEKVRARKSWRVSLAYFYWELFLLTVTKAKKRLVGATIGPLLKRLFVGSS